MKAIREIIAILLVGLIANPLVYAKDTGKTAKESIKFYFGYKPIVVITGSMEPVIKAHSVSIVKECNIEEVNEGDIIMYRSHNGLNVVHRVIDVVNMGGKKALITKGDANRYEDIYPVTEEMLYGKVVMVINEVAPLLEKLVSDYSKITPLYSLRVSLVVVLTCAAIVRIVRYLVKKLLCQ